MAENQPPVRELLDFDEIEVVNGIPGGQILIAHGTQPDHWKVELEDDVGPAIPEREWIPWHLVGYHFGEFLPDPQPFNASRDVPAAPPDALGIEVVGKSRREQVRLW